MGAFKLFEIPGVALGLGIRVGGDWLAQTFTTTGTAPDRGQWVWRAAPMGQNEIPLHALVTLQLEGGAHIYLMDLLNEEGTHGLSPCVVRFGGLALGVYLP